MSVSPEILFNAIFETQIVEWTVLNFLVKVHWIHQILFKNSLKWDLWCTLIVVLTSESECFHIWPEFSSHFFTEYWFLSGLFLGHSYFSANQVSKLGLLKLKRVEKWDFGVSRERAFFTCLKERVIYSYEEMFYKFSPLILVLEEKKKIENSQCIFLQKVDSFFHSLEWDCTHQEFH